MRFGGKASWNSDREFRRYEIDRCARCGLVEIDKKVSAQNAKKLLALRWIGWN